MKLFIDHKISSDMGIDRWGETKGVPLVRLIMELQTKSGMRQIDLDKTVKNLELYHTTKTITLTGSGDGWYETK